jgi:hypothetical protein
VNFQEVANVTERGDCSGESDINPQGDAHFALPGDEVTAGARSLLAAALRLATWPCGKSGLFGPSLDLEIIAQGEAEEKNEGDRNDVLAKATREWADGDSVAAHYGFGIDQFCSEDFGKSASGRSVLDCNNRKWLSEEFGIRFVTLAELARG